MQFNIIILLVVVAIIVIIFGYNYGIKLKNYTAEAFSTMDVYLKKRWDLVPSFAECVKAYAKHEASLFKDIAALRSKNYNFLEKEEKLDVNTTLTSVLPQVVAVAENYPGLKADETFIKLMHQLSQIEDDIANSRKYYNATVRELNTFLEIFPTNLIGKIFGIKKETMFEINSEQRENVKAGV